MRQARFRKKGELVMCHEDAHLWYYRGKKTSVYDWITCPQCSARIRLSDALLPTGKR